MGYNCGDNEEWIRSNRIVGGSDVRWGEVPWQVRLRIQLDNAVMQCGAVLIDTDWVLTAAHCVTYCPNLCSDITAYFGEHRLINEYKQSKAVQMLLNNKERSKPYDRLFETNHYNEIIARKAAKVMVNNRFNEKTFEGDIALIKVNQSIRFSDNIQPICLPKVMENFAGETGFISGFGVLKSGSKQVPHNLQISSVSIFTTTFCEYMLRELGYDIVKWGQLCAGVIDGGRDACAGDSGGPLTVRRSEDNKWVLVGIISNGIKCGQPN
ncbi:unnamed protein product, partial [Medioppia subpectinata]